MSQNLWVRRQYQSNPETESLKEVKVWQFDRTDMPKQWKAAIIAFAETSPSVSL
jgi:hypothetical protein